MNIPLSRYRKEIRACYESKEFELIIDSSDMTQLYMIFTIEAGIYEGQRHAIRLKLKYGDTMERHIFPFSPPKCEFLTQVWHPNIGAISTDGIGIVCVDSLNSEGWSSRTSLENICMIIKLLLLEPNVDSPQNVDAANQLIENPIWFKEHVENYYNESDNQKIIDELREMCN
jgi:ubiquitin-protein ligase